MAPEPESLVLQLLRDMRAEMSDMRTQMATKSDVAELRAELKSDMHSLRADMAADLLTTRKELGEQIVGLRRAVVEYHTKSSVMASWSASSKAGFDGSNNTSI